MPENIFKNFGARQNQFRSGCRPLFRQTAGPRPRRFISQPAFAPPFAVRLRRPVNAGKLNDRRYRRKVKKWRTTNFFAKKVFSPFQCRDVFGVACKTPWTPKLLQCSTLNDPGHDTHDSGSKRCFNCSLPLTLSLTHLQWLNLSLCLSLLSPSSVHLVEL